MATVATVVMEVAQGRGTGMYFGKDSDVNAGPGRLDTDKRPEAALSFAGLCFCPRKESWSPLFNVLTLPITLLSPLLFGYKPGSYRS
jgi:hypothetical protein